MNWNGQKCHNTLIQAHQRVKKKFRISLCMICWCFGLCGFCMEFPRQTAQERRFADGRRGCQTAFSGFRCPFSKPESSAVRLPKKNIWVVVSNIFCFISRGNDPIWLYNIFQLGWIETTNYVCFFFETFNCSQWNCNGGLMMGLQLMWMNGWTDWWFTCLMKWRRQQLS